MPNASLHRLLVEGVRDYAIFPLDPGGHIVGWNAGARRLKGYEAGEIIGQHFSIFYPRAAVESGHPERELVAAAQDGSYEEEGWRVRKDGSYFWAQVTITALYDETGTLVGFGKVTRDLTERRAAERQAIEDARRVAEAEASNRTKGELLTVMSHELRTPLNAIGGHADLLRAGIHGSINEAQADALDRIRTNQQHLLGLITDLLNFGRIDAGRLKYDLESVNLADVAEAAKPAIEIQAQRREIAIEWPESPDEVRALADRARTQQILLNLLTNAVKYTQRGGRVSVRWFATARGAALEVADNGPGIPADQQEAIFEPFVQVGRSLSSTHEGTGLGLAISRELARAMGGDLTVRSRADAGSVFTLVLPPSVDEKPAGPAVTSYLP